MPLFRLLFFILAVVLTVSSCAQNDSPNVSGIEISTNVLRFEQDFFSADTNELADKSRIAMQKYPEFAPHFYADILGTNPGWQGDTLNDYLKLFRRSYISVYDSSQDLFKNFAPYAKQIENGLKYVKFYFPKYPVPQNIITYVGPINGYGDLLDKNAIVIGLQHHLGAAYSMYSSEMVAEVYPEYITRQFSPEYIPINAMKLITSDIYPPDESGSKALIMQMVEQGKRLFMMQRFLPDVAEYKLLNYTEKQWSESKKGEAFIWEFFLKNNLLQSTEESINKNYIGDSPKTQELGEAAPGNIGSFIGLQIVKKYMDGATADQIPQLLQKAAEKIYKESKYKP